MTAHVHVSSTPNENALKFSVNKKVIESGYRHFKNAGETEGYPLAKNLFAIDGVTAVFFMAEPGTSFITVTKDPDVDWSGLQSQILACIQASV